MASTCRSNEVTTTRKKHLFLNSTYFTAISNRLHTCTTSNVLLCENVLQPRRVLRVGQRSINILAVLPQHKSFCAADSQPRVVHRASRQAAADLCLVTSLVP